MDQTTAVPKEGTKQPAQSPPPPLAPQRSSSSSSIHKGHRSSFAENLRGVPPSPRSQRHPSLTQAAIQDLLNHPPTARNNDPRFAGRDWTEITIGELVSQDDVRWVEMDTSVEDTTMALLKNTSSNVILIREDASSTTAVSTFDYNDLNAYVLVVVGLAHPTEELVSVCNDIGLKAQARVDIPIRDIQPICRKESLVTLQADEDLLSAIELFAGGIHRILVTNRASEVVGVLSQLKLIEFFWNESVHFSAIDELYPKLLRDLGIGSQQIISVNAESALSDALNLMSQEGLSSVAVTDNASNVVGNISSADVRHLTNAASLPLLSSSCLHFISVILTERGTEKGKDSFPVFHVNPYSTLAHTVAKLVATRSHRMWVVESASPSPSAPATPLLGPQSAFPTQSSTQASLSGSHLTAPAAPSLSGMNLSGRLTGVITLTDILNLFAKSTGLKPSDPNEQRARRRRSSSASLRPSLDATRTGTDIRTDFRRHSSVQRD
ncbi:hypothetical protein Micbo1qcDRAFT_196107 [Microdochium bolleyi]|uniref:Protein SDS23 n=1 Tax=Microdochium bolleyi TaxID=196109 RepID=A0A136J088_9PEZI|nr:hypothetical protein Micbo1qcDRAFT_196107 [Microdochium bolleyi]